MKRSKEQILNSYIKFIDFMADFLGSDYEIVLHDVEEVEKSIVHIRNNFSGRHIGGDITDLELRVLKEKEYLDKDYYVNYNSKTFDGRILRSATYFINDDDDKLIAMLCINIDVTQAKFLLDFMEGFVKGEKQPEYKKTKNDKDKHVTENLSDSVEDIAHKMTSEVISKYSIPVSRMTLEEKKAIIFELDKKGFFLIKGTVKNVANRLNISETTVYRCISSY